MTGHDEKRRHIEELLPFYLNGTLEDDERTEVEAALAEDETLRWELEFLEGVQKDVRSREVGTSPGEFGLARLMRDIESETREAPVGNVVVGRFWKVAAAAVFALFVAQATVMVTSPGTIVELAGGGAEVADGPTLAVAFQPDATERDIRELLLELELEIVGGPSALGLYTVAIAGEAEPADVISDLTASAIVESAEEE